MATIKDVAERAGVSISSVSIALKHDPRVKESTRKRIAEVAQSLGYRPNGIARDLKMQQTQTIAIFLHDLGGPFYSELVSGVQDVALSYGYSPIVACSVGGRGVALDRLLLEGRVDGAIILDHYIEEDFIRNVASPKLPIVLLERDIRGCSDVYRVTSDHEDGAYGATRHLLENGYRQIAFVGGPNVSEDGRLRFRGHVRAVQSFGFEIDKSFIIPGDFTEQSGYEAGLTLVLRQQMPDAVFAGNDEMAIGILRAFSERSIRVPEDIALVGFDDIRLTQYTSPTLTTVHQPMYELGTVASQILFRAFDGEQKIDPVILKTWLVVRGSSGPKK
ncbi:MAG: LacI family DNA-binding transcriptional regulator [Bacilli bacterium]